MSIVHILCHCLVGGQKSGTYNTETCFKEAETSTETMLAPKLSPLVVCTPSTFISVQYIHSSTLCKLTLTGRS